MDAMQKADLKPFLLESSRDSVEEWLLPPLREHDAVVVVGGDGLVHLVAPHAAQLDVPLLHHPSGTENLFAREFTGSPKAQPAQVVVERVKKMSTLKVDIAATVITDEQGMQSRGSMILMASAGLDANVVHDVSESRSGGIGKSTYVMPILRNVLRWRGTSFNLKVDGEEVLQNGRGMVVIANSAQYAIRMNPARNARMNDGQLDVIILPARTGFGLCVHGLRCLLGSSYTRDQRMCYRTGKEIEVVHASPCQWQVDGDPLRVKKPVSGIKVTVEANSLLVIE
jgi:diacylglycerol kinase family enzyme